MNLCVLNESVFNYTVLKILLLLYFSGEYCTQDVDECAANPGPCRNGGTCQNKDEGFECFCVNGWEGYDCSINVDDCRTNNCLNGGTCHDQVGYYTCECPVGKTGTYSVK